MAKTLNVLDATGAVSGATVELPEQLFDVASNIPLIHQVVVAQRAAARQGTHKTKNRGEVSGSGRKPFKQKGTGRSRQGSVRAPEHTGGGVVHGPQPRDYSQRTPKKMIAAALFGALSDRARADRVHAVTAFTATEAPSTKTALGLLTSIGIPAKSLVVTTHDDELTQLSVRNAKDVHVLTHDQLNAYDVLVADDIVFTQAALEAFIAARVIRTEGYTAEEVSA